MDENNNIKISDFGISALVKDQNIENKGKDMELFSTGGTQRGRADFVCPEIIKNQPYTYQADIYSLGLTILYLMSFRKPISIIKDENGKLKERNILKDYMLKNYNEYLRNLVLALIDDNNNINKSISKDAKNELEMIEKYIENPKGNASIKSDLDKKNNSRNIKRSKSENVNSTPQVNQNNSIYNQNNQIYQNNQVYQNNQIYQNNQVYQNNQIYQNNQFNQNNINNQIYQPGNLYPCQNNVCNPYTNINNQIYPQNAYTVCSPNQIIYQNNQGFTCFPNNNNQNQNMMTMNPYVANQNMANMGQINNQNMMSMSQNVTNQNMMAMSQINNQNMRSLSANNLRPYIIKPTKITSLIRVLQCLYGCFEDIGDIQNLKNMIKACYEYKINKYSFSFEILEIISLSINPDNNFINLVVNLRNKINQLTNNLFSKDEEVSPNFIFPYIFRIIDDEYIRENIPYNNYVFEGLETIKKIPQCFLSPIFEKMKKFEKYGNSPCFNFFYFLFLEVIKCPKCNNILSVNDNSLLGSNFIGVPGGFSGNVSYLIKYSMKEESENANQVYTCKCGTYSGNGITEKALLNAPKYLFIDFEGQMKIQRQLDEKIDLTEYKLTDIGPDQYYLYAFITKSLEGYIAYVKNGSSWTSYSDETTIMSAPYISFDCIPFYAIYKGME